MPRTTSLTADTISWVERCLGPHASVVEKRPLGGITGPWKLTVTGTGSTTDVVLRDGDPTLAHERSRFDVEVAALQAAEDLRVAAPRLIAHDLTGEQSSRLAVLCTHLAGQNRIPRMATHHRLVSLGRAAASLNHPAHAGLALPFRKRPLADLDFAGERSSGTTTTLLQEADDYLANDPPTATAPILVHGDCWQGNMLWHGDTFTGFVDWDAAGIGPPGLDLGNLRFDAALYFGLDGLDAITRGWTDTGAPPIDRIEYWDILAALSSPTDLSTWTPTITSPGRSDLDTRTITTRRDDFIKAALRTAGA